MYNVLMDYEQPPKAPRDRNNPVRRRSSDSDYSLMEFMQRFPDDAACLDRLWRDRFAPDGHHAHCPTCERERKFHRTKSGRPTPATPAGCTSTREGHDLRAVLDLADLWFYAMFLMASTRCGISAKQLERELGVTYKQAHKMMKRSARSWATMASRCKATWRSTRHPGAESLAAAKPALALIVTDLAHDPAENDRARDGRAWWTAALPRDPDPLRRSP